MTPFGNLLAAILPLSALMAAQGLHADVKPLAHPNKVDIQIEGGTVATKQSTPWQVSLIKRAAMSPYDGVFCGGVLLDSYWVLTAAHCVVEKGIDGKCRKSDVGNFYVGHSTTDLGSNVTLVTAQEIHVPSTYDCHSKQHDVALLKLLVPADSPVPIRLPTAADAVTYLKVGKLVTVTGWGLTSEKGWKSAQLLEVAIPIVSESECRSQYGDKLPIGSICAGAPGKHSCTGDSGGPLFVGAGKDAVILGVVSFGDDCGKGKIPGVYAPVTEYLKWISDSKSCKPSTKPPFVC